MKRFCIATTLLAALLAAGATVADAQGQQPRTAVVADTAWGGGCGPDCPGGY